MSVREMILAYHGDLAGDPHHRYRSWEHCYGFFQRNKQAGILARREDAALQLGFYLASWGMYRGSSFLLQHAYSIHMGVVECLASSELTPLWENDVGSSSDHASLAPVILEAVEAVRDAYRPFNPPTATLVTKVLLGTVGCLPACDRYFIDGFKISGFSYSKLNVHFVNRILQFCFDHSDDLQSEQVRIETASGVKYPFMKLADMYFWQTGYEANMQSVATESESAGTPAG
jgi:hypothetical protein